MLSTEKVGPQVPTFDSLFNPTLDAIRASGGSATIAEITSQIIEQLGLGDEVIQVPHGNGTRTELEYRLAWSRTYLKKGGLIDNSERGVWALTTKGREASHVDPRPFANSIRQLDAVEESASIDQEPTESDSPRSIEDSTFETATWRETVLECLLNISPNAFERLCQRILRESGFIEVVVTGKTADGGIDGHGIIRFAGLISFPVMFQCKRYTNNVPASAVRDFRGGMQGRAEKGLILTTSGFTRGAYEEATRDGAPPIDLINGDLLIDKLKELRLGVSTTSVEVVEVKKEWFDSI